MTGYDATSGEPALPINSRGRNTFDTYELGYYTMIKPACRFNPTRYRKAEWACLFLGVASSLFGETPKPPSVGERKARTEFLSLPLSFEANRGQTNPAVKFLSRGDGYALFLTADTAVFTLRPFRFRCENAGSASKIPISHSYPVMPNSFSTNFSWATVSPFATRLALPFLIMSIASIPRSVRQAVGTEPYPLASQVRRFTFL